MIYKLKILIVGITLIVMSVLFLPSKVSAASDGFPDSKFVTNMNEQQGLAYVDQFYNNSTVIARGFNKQNSILCISYNGSNNTYDVACLKADSVTYHQTRYYVRPNFYTAYSVLCDRSDNTKFIYARQISSVANNDYSLNSDILPSYTLIGINFCPDYNNFYYCYVVDPMNDYLIYNRPQEFTAFVYNNSYIPPFVRDDYTFYGLDLSINETSFYDWIIENNKLSELPSYITQAKLLSFIDFYSNFGGSFTNFLKNIPDWFSHMSIVNQTKDNVNILKSSMDKLYQEYINSFYREVGYHSSVELPHHRRNIQTQTTDDDTTLITDDQNDTLIESILRDILRGVIQISNQIGDGVNSIINKLSELNFTTTVVNNGGNNDTDTDVEGIDSDISDTMAESIEDVPTLDTEVPNLLSAPAVVGGTVNIYLNVFQSMGLDKILIFAVTVSFLIIKIRGNTK